MNAHARIEWTGEQVELLTKLWATSLSAREIAGEIGGITRNAVIGKAAREGLPRRPRTPSANPRKPRARTIRALQRAAILATEMPDIPHDTSDCAVTIHQLEDHHCRFPLAEPSHDMEYCGARKIDGLSYCARHARVAFTAPQPRKARPYSFRDAP